MTDYMANINESREDINNVVQELFFIGHALDYIGNEKLGDQLYDIANRLEDSMQVLMNTIDEDISIRLNKATDNATEILNNIFDNYDE